MRGGKRKGAGRSKKKDQEKVLVYFRISSELIYDYQLNFERKTYYSEKLKWLDIKSFSASLNSFFKYVCTKDYPLSSYKGRKKMALDSSFSIRLEKEVAYLIKGLSEKEKTRQSKIYRFILENYKRIYFEELFGKQNLKTLALL